MAGKVKSRKMPVKILGFWHIYIFVSLFAIILTGCTNPNPNPNYFSNLTPEQKKVELKKELDRKFEDPEKQFLLGQLYHAEKAWDDAEFCYNNALRFDPLYRPAQAAMIKLLIDRGDSVKAQHYFESYLNQAGNSPTKLILFALELQQQQLDSYALNCYQKALEIAPNSAQVHKYVASYYLSKNDKSKAIEYYKNSFKLDGNQPDVARELGKLGVPIVYDGKPGDMAAANQ